MNDDTLYSPEIQTLITNKKFADAINACNRTGVSSHKIQEMVRKEVQKANNALEMKKYDEAMKIFLSTVGSIEPSMVLCRFFAPHLTHYLTTFLIELHKRGYATEQHTRLLFGIFRQEDVKPRLLEFIQMIKLAKAEEDKKVQDLARKEKENNFSKLFSLRSEKQKEIVEDLSKFYEQFKKNAGSAIEVLVQNDMENEAFTISSLLPASSMLVKLMIQSQGDYKGAAEMIMKQCNELGGRHMLLEHGASLLDPKAGADINQMIEQAAALTWRNDNECIDFQFLKMFWGYPKSLLAFLKNVCQDRHTPLLATSFIDLQIPRNHLPPSERTKLFFGHPDVASSEKALQCIKDKNIKYDENQILFICKETGFVEGVIAVFDRQGKYQEIALYLISHCKEASKISHEEFSKAVDKLVKWCMNKVELSSDDWYSVFSFCRDNYSPKLNIPIEFLQTLVLKVKEKRPITTIIEELSRNNSIPVDVIKEVLNKEIRNLVSSLSTQQAQYEQRLSELKSLETQIYELETVDIEIKPMKCDICGTKLEEPFICFFCGHKVHSRCAQYEMGNNPKCPKCYNKSVQVEEKAKNSISLSEQVDLLDPCLSLIRSGYLSN